MESHQKEDFEVEVFSPLRILTSPLFGDSWSFSFSPSFFIFFNMFSLFFLSFLCSVS
jgi:hypothetical protein